VISTSRAWTKEGAEAQDFIFYGQSVINEGESFLYYSADGKEAAWYDWSIIAPIEAESMNDPDTGEVFCLDNFCIKAYCLPVKEEEQSPPAEKIQQSLSDLNVTGIKNKTYTGKPITQKITVTLDGKTLKEGADYSISYKNNTKVGTATLTIAGKNGYTGSKSRTFKINPKGTKISKLRSCSKAFKVAWKKPSTQISGYQIQYSTRKSFASGNKTKTIKGSSATSKKITGLKSRKTYYVRIRTYKTVNGKKYYSSWSSAKPVRTN